MPKTKTIEEKYVKLSPIEHILKKPSMYIGSTQNSKDTMYIYDKKIIIKEILWSPALYKIIDELIVNCYDQSIRDKSVSIVTCIINENSFSIFNDGTGIDIIKHKDHNIYIPELIFGNLLTSTNYDENEQRITGGTHGLGAKLTAIFSKKFILEVWDKKRKLSYYQTFENNLSIISKPIIIKNKSNIKGGVRITIFPDFNKLQDTDTVKQQFSIDMIQLIKKRLIDLTGLMRDNIIININGDDHKANFNNYLLNYNMNWIVGNCIKNNLWNFAIQLNQNNMPNISFVNGIYTNRGGKHIDYFIDLLLIKLQKLVTDLTKKILIENITICLVTSIINPTFNSQTKEELLTPISKFGFECNISDQFWTRVKNSDIIVKLQNIVAISNMKTLAKFEGSKKSKIKNIPKLEDANYAGTKKSDQCVLILTEGDSAKATAISGISAIPNGRNHFGVYPLKGKLLNVREASTTQLNNNTEIIDIKKILALKSGTIYTKDNINELRYHEIMIMTDADEDGSHIKGLIINFFDYFFPSLLAMKFIKILVTPLIKVTKNKEVLNFANLRTFKSWKEQTKDSNMWKIKYYKGLGTSTSKEAGEYFQNLDNNIITLIDKTVKPNPDILLAFSKEKINERKKWLNQYNPDIIKQFIPPTTITIKEFVHQELIHFSNYDNIRSIPSILDGLKPSQRKVLYTCIKRNLYNEIKVAQLAASVAEISAYHHGEQSLVSTIINMAQDFVGSNNMNILVPQGQMGTRLMGGKDHSSARYIYTFLQPFVSKVFNSIDNMLLEYLEDEGYSIEPKFYLPIIPMILVNGSEGIGTGYSTFIPNYNPNDIILWLENKLNNKATKKLTPYYKNFKGIYIKYDEDTWISQGILTINMTKYEIIITELPVKMWTNDYKEFLEILIEKREIIKSFINLSSDVEVKFILKFDATNIEAINKLNIIDSNNMNQLYKYLHLYKTLKISNMNLYNAEYIIKTFKSPEEILNTFYTWRLPFYKKRKELLLNKISFDMVYIENQLKFIKLVEMNNMVFKLDENKIHDLLNKNKITQVKDSYDYLLNMSFKQLSKANMENLTDKLKKLKTEYKNISIVDEKNIWLNDLIELKKII